MFGDAALASQLLEALGPIPDGFRLRPTGVAQPAKRRVELGLAGPHQPDEPVSHRDDLLELLATGRGAVPLGDVAPESLVDLFEAPQCHRPAFIETGSPHLQVPSHGRDGGSSLGQAGPCGSFGDGSLGLDRRFGY